MWAVVRYDPGDRQSENQKGPSVQVDVCESLERAQVKAFNYIQTGQWMLRYNLFVVEVE